MFSASTAHPSCASQELLPYRERPEHIPTCQHILEHSQARTRYSDLTLQSTISRFVTEFSKLLVVGGFYCGAGPSAGAAVGVACPPGTSAAVLTRSFLWQAPYALLLACDSLANLVTKHWGAFSTTDRVDIRECPSRDHCIQGQTGHWGRCAGLGRGAGVETAVSPS